MADFALQHQSVFDEQTALIRRQRGEMDKALRELPGLEVFPSEANFILVKTQPGMAQRIHAGLLEKGILIKLLSGSMPMLEDCLRITIGTEQENNLLMDALKSLL